MHLSVEEEKVLKDLVDHYVSEERSVRERQIKVWRFLKLKWEGFQQTWYDAVAHDWRVYDNGYGYGFDDTEQGWYDKPINVLRAYLESIIAALSVTVPPIKCYPENADSPLDIATAKAGDKAAILIGNHNESILKWVHGLFVFCTEGMTASYLYKDTDKEYGEYEEKKYESVTEYHQYSRCPNCGYDIDDVTVPEELKDKLEPQKDKFNPDDSDVAVQDVVQQPEMCPNCAQEIVPDLMNEPLVVERLVGVTKHAKSRVKYDVLGGLNVKVPNYARNQKECPYLIYDYETNFVNTFDLFEDCEHDDILDALKGATGPRSNYEEWARLSPQYNGEYPRDVVTVRKAWLRPCAFNRLEDVECKKFKKKFPNGAYVCQVNDIFASASNESLDDRWTLTFNPLADSIHFNPLGLLLVSVQELTNDLISLTIQTIEHGIPQTFADPGVLNFPAYRQLEANPGGVYEATPKSGKSVKDAFHEVKTASLSAEVLPFTQQLQSLGQLVSGALPSLFGGAIEGSETASQYSMSRAQALQRLQNVWKVFTSWWKLTNGKAIPMFFECIKEDERDVQRRKDGSFFNVVIRKSEIEGKIGKIELEANENLPITWGQRKDIIMKLMEAANPEILQVLAAPENLPIIREAIGLDGFFVPGEDDRDKQYDEIKELLNSAPIMDEMGVEVASVDVDPDFDNHDVEFEICRHWVTSEEGRVAKIDNHQGYRNVLLHGRLHLALMRQENAMIQQSEQAGSAPVKKTDKTTEINNESDVKTV